MDFFFYTVNYFGCLYSGSLRSPGPRSGPYFCGGWVIGWLEKKLSRSL